MSGNLNPNQFGIEPQEHIKMLQHAWREYEPPEKPEWHDDEFDGPHWGAGHRERGRPYGPEDFELGSVEELPEPDKYGSTHQVDIWRDKRYLSTYGWNRGTGEMQIWAD